MSGSHLSLRRAVWEILNHFSAAEHNCAELIEEFGAKTQNRSALVDITLGIIRNSVFIDSLITQTSIQPKSNIPAKTLNCLRIAFYELVFSNRPVYAVVNEAVSLAGKIGSKKSAGFVNAVLRKACAHIKERNVNLGNSDPQKTLPLTPTLGTEFDIDILPDPDRNKAEYLSIAFSLPLWLIEQWLTQFGPEKTADICFASNRRPAVYARANRLKLTPQELFEILKGQNINCDFIEKYKMVRLNKPGNISEMNFFKEGLFTIQDITSSLVVPLLNPQPGWKIFDICAAPGTKTTQIAELIDDKGLIIATDKDNVRLAKLDENTRRLGITSVRTTDYEAFLKDSSHQSCADAVLLDVPCSNTGVLARRPEVRYRLNVKILDSFVKMQSELLKLAATFVTEGGKICYSTCSILQQENSDVVNAFIKQQHRFSPEKESLVLPSAASCDFDGGYAAILVKK